MQMIIFIFWMKFYISEKFIFMVSIFSSHSNQFYLVSKFFERKFLFLICSSAIVYGKYFFNYLYCSCIFENNLNQYDVHSNQFFRILRTVCIKKKIMPSEFQILKFFWLVTFSVLIQFSFDNPDIENVYFFPLLGKLLLTLLVYLFYYCYIHISMH